MVTMMNVWVVTMATFIVAARNTYGGVTITDPASGYLLAVVGDTVSMVCLNTDNSEVEWIIESPFGEVIIEDNPPFVLTATQDASGNKLFLTIEGVEKQDAGDYICRSVADQSDSQKVSLTVNTADTQLPTGWVPPRIDRREGQETIEVEVGKELRLRCQGGSTDSVLEFRHNGDVINVDTHNLITKAANLAQNVATIILSRDPAETDYSGTYSCHDVDYPQTSDSVEVDVIEHPSTRVEIIEPSGTHTKVMVGENFSLKCQSSDQTTMVWFHDDVELEDQVGGYLIALSENRQDHTRTSILTKEDAEFADAGQYRCVNEDSPQDDATIQVDIRAEGDDGDTGDDDDGDGDDDDNDGDGDDDDDDGFLGGFFNGAAYRPVSALFLMPLAAIFFFL